MRIVVLSQAFSKKTGYIENALPKYLARLGHDVHVITTGLPPYFHLPDFSKTYGSFTGEESLRPGLVETHNGFTLHVVASELALGYVRLIGLYGKLKSLRPDVVQVSQAVGWLPLQAALARPFLGFRLFTGNHTHASVFPLAQDPGHFWSLRRLRNLALRAAPGRLISLVTERCYATTKDCADIAVQFLGVQRKKVEICPLGVDPEHFHPTTSTADRDDRHAMRAALGLAPGEIVCIYSGRFTKDKNPALLGHAIARLRGAGEPFRGLFVGAGAQDEEIQGCDGCIVRPFVPFTELGRYFRAADIGVWPTQESMSMLDASACGLPIVINDTVAAPERTAGTGLVYRLNQVDSLIAALLSLKSLELRAAMGTLGANRMAGDFSWDIIARRRARDYSAALMERR